MTEKNYNPEQGKQHVVKQETKQKVETPIEKKEEKVNDKVEEQKKEEGAEQVQASSSTSQERKKTPTRKTPVEKKDEAVVNGFGLNISTKDAVAICKFIRGKPINRAVEELEEVLKFKRAIPMKGEIPHRKGKGMMSGRYPIYAVRHFIRMLKDLKANANVNMVEEPIIVEAVPNKAAQPYGRFGAFRRKRTHVKIVAKEKNKMGGRK